MRRLVATTAAVAVLSLGLSTTAPPPAQAQIAVIDPQAVVQAIKQVEQQLQMITQLQQQVASQAAMLQKLGVDVTGPLQQIASEATQLLQAAQGIGYQGQNLAQQFQQVYPTDLKGVSFAQTRQALAGWQANSRQTLQEAMATQNLIVRSQPTTAGAVNAAVAASQNAAGQTAAIQATNQLLASLSTQLTQLQTILITQGRAQQTAEAQAQAARAAGDAEHERVFHGAPPAAIGVKNSDHL
ncbi:conjugal transfer protein TrbJ (plasmid) [Caulobacter sp. ErkDOM-YI]|uniref:conjugal transfer protein TrbJ n=1 Tax=unclassified Caulobacter TaxID=2648921 RepID=UPI003AF717AB